MSDINTQLLRAENDSLRNNLQEAREEIAALKAELATAYATEDPGDHVRWRAAEQEVERLQQLRASELPLQWPCGCGFARAKIEIIDSGTALCCEECGRKVVVRLEVTEEGGADEPDED